LAAVVNRTGSAKEFLSSQHRQIVKAPASQVARVYSVVCTNPTRAMRRFCSATATWS